MLKPISGAASLGVVRVDDLQGMRTCYERIQDELARTVYKDGAIFTSESHDVDTNVRICMSLPSSRKNR